MIHILMRPIGIGETSLFSFNRVKKNLIRNFGFHSPFSFRRFSFFIIHFSLFVSLFFVLPHQVQAQTSGRQKLTGHLRPEWANAAPAGTLPAAKQLNLAIGLPLRNPEALQRLLDDLYDPQNPQYRHFLTPDKFAEMFGASDADYQAVVDFAQTHGLQVTQTYSNRLLVAVSGTVKDIEATFHLRLNQYNRGDGSQFFAPDSEPSADLDTPILHISGLDDDAVYRHNGSTGKLADAGPRAPGVGAAPRTARDPAAVSVPPTLTLETTSGTPTFRAFPRPAPGRRSRFSSSTTTRPWTSRITRRKPASPSPPSLS